MERGAGHLVFHLWSLWVPPRFTPPKLSFFNTNLIVFLLCPALGQVSLDCYFQCGLELGALVRFRLRRQHSTEVRDTCVSLQKDSSWSFVILSLTSAGGGNGGKRLG